MKIPSLGAIGTWASSVSKSARIARFVGTAGLLWTIVQFLDRFDKFKMPDGYIGIALFAMIFLATYEFIELLFLEIKLKEFESADGPATFTPEEAFASGILRYAQKLNQDDARRDTAVLDLRSWASRTLHLVGANEARYELGQIALSAAMNIDDRLAQVSILIDELGWTCHLLNNDDGALRNLTRATELLEQIEATVGPSTETRLLRVKAARHRANIAALTHTLEESRRMLQEARSLAETLPEPHRTANAAQIDHSDGALILKYLDRTLGNDGKCDPHGETSKLLTDGIRLARDAGSAFTSLGDKERELKVALLLTGLLRHSRDDSVLRSARQRLARLKQEAERTAYLP